MERSPPCEANRSSVSQEIPCALLSPNVHYRIHKRPPLALTLSQIKSVHATHPTSRRPTLILSSHLHLVFQVVCFHSSLTTKTLHAPLVTPVRATCPAHLILVDLITRIISVEKCRSLSSSLCRSLTVC